jgi:hypothetical protein
MKIEVSASAGYALGELDPSWRIKERGNND